MERPIIIWLKDDGKITKETLEEVARKAYEQGYEDGKKASFITAPPYTYPCTYTYKSGDLTVSEVDTFNDIYPPYCG